MTRLLAALAVLLALAAVPVAQTAYPNPLAYGPLTVVHDAEATFELYDLMGRRIPAGQSLAAGVYLWRLRAADGTATPVRRLTRLMGGPLDVRLVTARTLPALVPGALPRPDAPEARGQGGACDAGAGRALYGGLVHAPGSGSQLTRGDLLAVAGGARGASVTTCVQGLNGLSLRFPSGLSPFGDGDGGLMARVGGVAGGAPFEGVLRFERRADGTVDVSGGVDPATARRVEVIRYDADGEPEVVGSAEVPPGTPLAQAVARVSAPGPFDLAFLTTTGWTTEPTDSGDASASGYRGDVLGMQADFRSASGVTVEIGGTTVQGDALAITTETDGVVQLDEAGLQSSASGFALDAAIVTYETRDDPDHAPAWVRTHDGPASGQFMSSAGANPTVRVSAPLARGLRFACGAGETCDRFGFSGSSSVAATADMDPTTLFSTRTMGKGGAQEAARRPNRRAHGPIGNYVAGGFESAPGEGLLRSRSESFEQVNEVVLLASGETTTHALRVTFQRGRGNQLSIRMDEDCGDGPCAVQGFEMTVVRKGRVHGQETMAMGRAYRVRTRFELVGASSGFASTASASPTVRTAPDSGSEAWGFGYAVRASNGDGVVWLRPILADPSASLVGVAGWSLISSVPWSLGFMSSASASPTI